MKNISLEEKAKKEEDEGQLALEAKRKLVIEKQMVVSTNKQLMYSWKNEKGIRVFSNVGFPEDGKYSEGKMEWY